MTRENDESTFIAEGEVAVSHVFYSLKTLGPNEEIVEVVQNIWDEASAS